MRDFMTNMKKDKKKVRQGTILEVKKIHPDGDLGEESMAFA